MSGTQISLSTIVGAGVAIVVAGVALSSIKKRDGGVGGETGEEEEDRAFAGFPTIRRDAHLTASLRELCPLYSKIDKSLFNDLLHALEDLACMQGAPSDPRSGQRNVARALRARRRGNAALSDLRNGAQRRFPSQAVDTAEDHKIVLKAIADSLHNIQQSCTLCV